MVQPNGTHAKELALHFIKTFGMKSNPSTIARTIKQIKTTLADGHSKDDIEAVINYLANVKNMELYSFGYIQVSIDAFLRDAKNYRDEKDSVGIREEQEKIFNREVVKSDESSERNREKTTKFGTESRFGKKFDFDMHSKTRQDN